MERNEVIKLRLIKVVDFAIRLMLIGIIVLLSSCEGSLEDQYEWFLIPKGKHSQVVPKVQTLQSHSLAFKAIFDESAMYSTTNVENQHDINKLMGFSDCNVHHHENSARFGWRWLNGVLEIHAYTYHEGVRSSEYIGEVDLNKSYHYEIALEKDHYTFLLEGHDPVRMERAKKCTKGFYYMLFPYFGGNENAPHDIMIRIMQTSF